MRKIENKYVKKSNSRDVDYEIAMEIILIIKKLL